MTTRSPGKIFTAQNLKQQEHLNVFVRIIFVGDGMSFKLTASHSRIVVAATFALTSRLALAEDGATLTLNLPLLLYSSDTAKSTPDDGTASSKKTTGTWTAQLSQSYGEVQWGNMIVYVYPFYDSKLISASYMVVPDLVEIGLDLGLNSLNIDKPRQTSSSNTFGIFGWLYPKLGDKTAELGLEVDSTSSSGEEVKDVSGVATTFKTSLGTTLVKVSAGVVFPLVKNLSYAGGIYYQFTQTDDKEAKVKTSHGEFGLNIASLRLTLN